MIGVEITVFILRKNSSLRRSHSEFQKSSVTVANEITWWRLFQMHTYVYSFFSCYIIFLEGCREKQCIIVLWMVMGMSGVISVSYHFCHHSVICKKLSGETVKPDGVPEEIFLLKIAENQRLLIVWFNANKQLSTKQPLAHFLHYPQRDGVRGKEE